jgi:hypothetical protein
MLLLTYTAVGISLSLQEVNLANNQLASLPELWTSLWGMPNPSTGLLTTTSEPESSSAGDAKKDTSGGGNKVKVLVLGNPLMQP